MGGSTTVQAPAPVDPAQVGRDTLQTQLDLAPQVFSANQEYLPQYADLALRVAGSSLPTLLQQQASANSSQRASDIADVRAYGADALAAYRAANPELTNAQEMLRQRITSGANGPVPTVGRSGLVDRLQGDAGANLGQVSPLQLRLQQQAMEQLGADLSPAEIAKAQQDTRAAYAARGLYDSNQALGAEILNLDSVRGAKRAAAQQFALGVDQAGQQQVQANRGYGLNAAGLGLTQDQTNAQLRLGADQQATSNYFNLVNSYASTAQDPYQLVLGRSGAPATSLGLAGSAGPTMFDPFNPAVTSIYAGNTANQLAAQTATANNAAGVTGGAMAGLGALGGAVIIAA